jgi:hypothetical protein
MTANGLSSVTSEAGLLQRVCLDLLAEHQAAGALPTSPTSSEH